MNATIFRYLLPAVTLLAAPLPAQSTRFRQLPVHEFRDKMKAGWVGQMVGVAWGEPTEFKWRDEIIPEPNVPAWKPQMINASFNQDDLYVEMTFLRSLEQYGLDVSIRQAGIDFANSRYRLWCANDAARRNLRRGIAPPDSSHPSFTRCANDIDYQIEADFSGLIAPGMPAVPIALGEKFGRIMNYGDGMYAGQFIGAMYAHAFFESDPRTIVEKSLAAIPAQCQYAQMVRDLLKWSAEVPDWQQTWKLCQQKYREDFEYQQASNGGIDCKINGAYVLMGLLYGNGDLDRTIVISMRGGQDSDCNPSSAAGILATTIGFENLPDHYTSALEESTIFEYTAYSFPALLDTCENLARQYIETAGGRIENNTFIIPIQNPTPSQLQLTYSPDPIAKSYFTEAEMNQITIKE